MNLHETWYELYDMGAHPKALLFNFPQYDENMADIQTCEVQKTLTPLWYSLCCHFKQLQTDKKWAYLWKWMIFAS